MLKHTIRRGPFGRTTREVNLTRGKAIRYFCVECCGYSLSEPKECRGYHCPLYPYRLGRVDPSFGADDENADFDENEAFSDSDDGLDVDAAPSQI